MDLRSLDSPVGPAHSPPNVQSSSAGARVGPRRPNEPGSCTADAVARSATMEEGTVTCITFQNIPDPGD